MSNIHPTAVVHPKAKLGSGVTIGPYSLIHEHVTLKENVKVGSFCVVDGRTTIGRGTQLFTGAVIGSIPQDKKYNKEEKVFLEIGEENIFREYTTINTGTGEGGKTTIGNNNLFMVYSHLGHDCVVGSHCVVANCGAIAGHVTIEDNVIVGGLTGIHQFVRVGRLAIIGGCSKVVQDIPPFSMCDGHPARVFGLNLIGLKRSKISVQTVSTLKKAFKILFQSGLTKSHALKKIEQEVTSCAELEHLLQFLKISVRGLCG